MRTSGHPPFVALVAALLLPHVDSASTTRDDDRFALQAAQRLNDPLQRSLLHPLEDSVPAEQDQVRDLHARPRGGDARSDHGGHIRCMPALATPSCCVLSCCCHNHADTGAPGVLALAWRSLCVVWQDPSHEHPARPGSVVEHLDGNGAFVRGVASLYSHAVDLRYGQIYNYGYSMGNSFDLPSEIVERYAEGTGRRMAVTDYRFDIVRLHADGTETSVPLYDLYDHHHVVIIYNNDSRGLVTMGASFEYRKLAPALQTPFARVFDSPPAKWYPMMHLINTKEPTRTAGWAPTSQSELTQCPCTPQRAINVSAGTMDGDFIGEGGRWLMRLTQWLPALPTLLYLCTLVSLLPALPTLLHLGALVSLRRVHYCLTAAWRCRWPHRLRERAVGQLGVLALDLHRRHPVLLSRVQLCHRHERLRRHELHRETPRPRHHEDDRDVRRRQAGD